MDPATSTGTTQRLQRVLTGCWAAMATAHHSGSAGTRRQQLRAERRTALAAEGVSAGAAAGGVRVVDREALLLDGVREVDGGAGEVRGAHPVDDHRHAV